MPEDDADRKIPVIRSAIQTAGAVKSNKIRKHATSDFMEIERQREFQ
jgi:peptide chain release factor 3